MVARCLRSQGSGERWEDPAGTTLETCSVLTTTPNAVTSGIHDRMPVILDPDNYDLWLNPGMKDAETAAGILKPYDANAMSC
jgi:putative SOS response-associated peptidase YedK